jgi:hypothetical protein
MPHKTDEDVKIYIPKDNAASAEDKPQPSSLQSEQRP